MKHIGIDTGISNGNTDTEIARKIFLSYPTSVFENKHEIEFDIKNKISQFFDIPITSVQVAGSAKLGYSYHKSKIFEIGESDLDIAIINTDLYLRYAMIAFQKTNGYTDLSHFKQQGTLGGVKVKDNFIKYLARGILRPDLLPNCEEKIDWFKFFNNLSSEYIKIFKNINAGIYCNEKFYEHKQSDVIKKYKNKR